MQKYEKPNNIIFCGSHTHTASAMVYDFPHGVQIIVQMLQTDTDFGGVQVFWSNVKIPIKMKIVDDDDDVDDGNVQCVHLRYDFACAMWMLFFNGYAQIRLFLHLLLQFPYALQCTHTQW